MPSALLTRPPGFMRNRLPTSSQLFSFPSSRQKRAEFDGDVASCWSCPLQCLALVLRYDSTHLKKVRLGKLLQCLKSCSTMKQNNKLKTFFLQRSNGEGTWELVLLQAPAKQEPRQKEKVFLSFAPDAKQDVYKVCIKIFNSLKRMCDR